MPNKEGRHTTEWKSWIAVLIAACGSAVAAIMDKGLVEEGTTAWVILGALAAITGVTVKYMGARATTKAAELIGPEKK